MNNASYRIQKVRNFSKEHDFNDFGIVRVHTSILKTLGGRRTWVKISSNNPKHEIFRMCKGLGGAGGFDGESIELDYDSREDLGLKHGQPCNEDKFNDVSLTMQKASIIECFYAHWSHPDPRYKFPFRISLVSLILGFIGLFLGIMSYI